MKIRYRLLNEGKDKIFCNLQTTESAVLERFEAKSSIIKIDGKQVRCGVVVTADGAVYATSSDSDYLKSSKSFVSAIASLAKTLGTFRDLVAVHQQKVNSDTNRLIHNLITLNAHNIQEIYSVIPQDVLSKIKPNQQVIAVEAIVKEEPREVAFALLRIAKNNAAMKAEFSVFKKLFDSSPRLEKRSHNVHKVLMNILYLFFSDFTDKSVYIPTIVSLPNVTAFFDYESVHVALYHLIENAVKYVKPHTTLSISIKESSEQVEIIFDMISLPIGEKEKELIFEEGYSGEFARKTAKAGSGIGMNQAKKILEVNGASIEVQPNPSTLHDHIGIPYQQNIFTIKLSTKNK